MDLHHGLSIFDTLYHDIDGYSLSSQWKREHIKESGNKAYVYGEVSPEAFYKILSEIKFPKGVFYDLGSGTGKAVILASLFGNFQRLVGIELVDELYQASKSVLLRYEREVYPLLSKAQELEFIKDDFLFYGFLDADVLFMHSTCFTDSLWAKLLLKCKNLKKGCYIIMVTRTANVPYFELITSKEFGMAWGRATVQFYKKI